MTSGRSLTYLGTVLTPNGIQNSWYRTQLARGFTQIRSLSTKLPIHSLPLSKRVLIYKTFVRSSHEYLCQLGNLLGTNSLTARNLFRTALKEILLLPPNSDGNLLWIFLKIEPPHHRTTRLQWLWWMKLRGGENITRSLLDNDPLRGELTKPDILRLNQQILEMRRSDKSLLRSSPKSLARIFTTRHAWANLERTMPETFSLLKDASLTDISRRLDLSDAITQAKFFSTPSYDDRNDLIKGFLLGRWT
jgi:hypothetical protein